MEPKHHAVMRLKHIICSLLLALTAVLFFIIFTHNSRWGLQHACDLLGLQCNGYFENSLWIAIGTLTGCLGLIFFLWRCPQCKSFLGSINAQVCANCTHRLFGPILHSVKSPKNIQANKEKQKELERDIHGLSSTFKKIDKVLIGIFVATALARWLEVFSVSWAVLIGFQLIFYMAVQRIFKLMHVRLALKICCPSCEKSITTQSGPYCPFCGYEIADGLDS